MRHLFTNAEKNAMNNMTKMGLTTKQVADMLGLRYRQVYDFKYLEKKREARQAAAKTDTAAPSVTVEESKSRHGNRFTDEQKSAMISMLGMGMTNKQVADALGLTNQQVYDFKSKQKEREARLAAKRTMEAQPAPGMAVTEPAVVMAEAKPVAAADSGNVVQIDLPLAQGERIVRVPIKLKLDISVA